jgi:hypothetical protein
VMAVSTGVVWGAPDTAALLATGTLS